MPAQPPEGNTAMYEEVNRLVYEYLQVIGLEKAATAFQTECQAKSIPCPRNNHSKNYFNHYSAEKLLSCFDEGDLNGFFKIWTTFLSHIQLTSDDMKKLEVYIRVHFALWPRAHGEPEPIQMQAMNGLKIFFEEHSNELSSDAGILPLFALPYVPEPKSHPIFRDLFEPHWTQRLKEQLEKTLSKYFELVQENIVNHSKLASIVMMGQNVSGGGGGSEVYHQERFFQLIATYRKVRKLLRGTRESYGKLLKVTNELITGLEKTVEKPGELKSMEPIMETCFEIFPELFTSDNFADGKPDMNYFRRLASGAIFDSIVDSDVSLFFVGISDMSPDTLNYDKIKTVLVNGEPGDRLCLLQSLRWLLTKSTPKCRQDTIDAFWTNDILGLNSPDYRDKLFACMLSTTPTYMKECLARFLNAVASMKKGRSYLASTDYPLSLLVQSLHTVKEQNETFICQMVIATLQKMSLRKQMRLVMIEQKVIEWLVIHIKTELARGIECNANAYLMEYGWALLMNLCLHEESKGPTAAIAPDILTCVVQMLMAKPSPDVAPYVISTLYSLLRNPDIFAMAKRMRLQDTFAGIVAEDAAGHLSNHLKQVISLLSAQGYDRVNTSGEVDYDDDDCNDPDEFEPEIEVQETWVTSLDDGVPIGDDLLVRAYMRPGEVVVPSQKPIPLEKKQDRVFLRPTTPIQSKRPQQRPVTRTRKLVRRKESNVSGASTTSIVGPGALPSGVGVGGGTSLCDPIALTSKSFVLNKKTGKSRTKKRVAKPKAAAASASAVDGANSILNSTTAHAPAPGNNANFTMTASKNLLEYYDHVFDAVTANNSKTTGPGAGAGEDPGVNGQNLSINQY